MTSVMVCLACRVDADGFPDHAEALDAARTHDEERHDGRPVAFVASPEPVWTLTETSAEVLVAGVPGGGKGCGFWPVGGAA
jgi:hypothetical protein